MGNPACSGLLSSSRSSLVDPMQTTDNFFQVYSIKIGCSEIVSVVSTLYFMPLAEAAEPARQLLIMGL